MKNAILLGCKSIAFWFHVRFPESWNSRMHVTTKKSPFGGGRGRIYAFLIYFSDNVKIFPQPPPKGDENCITFRQFLLLFPALSGKCSENNLRSFLPCRVLLSGQLRRWFPGGDSFPWRRTSCWFPGRRVVLRRF